MKRYVPWLFVLLAGVGVGAVLTGSLSSLLPLMLLACPLMMVFMMWGMGGMRDGHSPKPRVDEYHGDGSRPTPRA